MIRRAIMLLFASAAAAPALAQVQPMPGSGNPHLQQVDYDPGQIVQLRGAPGYQMMVELSPDEQVQSVALGDSSAWQVSVNKEGDRLFIKPAQALASTNMTVVTSVRTYNFDLVPLSEPVPDMPYTVQFQYPAQPAQIADDGYVDVSSRTRRLSRYKVTGDSQLWPSSITDDGQHTFINWPRTASIPAVYAMGRFGRDELVNGMMATDDTYVIDGAPTKLTFRIDDRIAHAVRIKPKKAR